MKHQQLSPANGSRPDGGLPRNRFTSAARCLQNIEEIEGWLHDVGCQPGTDGLLQRCWSMHSSNSNQTQDSPCPSTVMKSAQQLINTAGQHTTKSCSWSAQHPCLPSSQEEWQQAWGLADRSMTPASLSGPQLQQMPPAGGLRQYYDLRGLPHNSPAGVSKERVCV